MILQTQTFVEKTINCPFYQQNCVTVMSFKCIYIFFKIMYNLCITARIKADSCVFLQSYCKKTFQPDALSTQCFEDFAVNKCLVELDICKEFLVKIYSCCLHFQKHKHTHVHICFPWILFKEKIVMTYSKVHFRAFHFKFRLIFSCEES